MRYVRLLPPLLFALFLSCALFATALRAQPNDVLALTAEEVRWLQEHPVLRLGVGVAFPPFQYVEPHEGAPTFKGMASDYVNLISRRLGVRMEPVFGITFKQALDMGRRGEIDLFPCIANTPERKEFLTFTKPYLSYPLVVITRDDAPIIAGVSALHGRKIAVVKALATYSKYENDLPNSELSYVFEATVPDVLTAVSLGRADACVVNLAVASRVIKEHGLANLRVAAPTPWENNNLAMAVPNDQAILADILTKVLASISQKEKDAISKRWISLESSQFIGLRAVLRWSFGIGIATLLIVAVVLAWNRTLRREVRERILVEEELRASRKDYQALFASMFGGFALHEIICDDTGKPVDYRFLEVNPAFEQLTGLTAEQVQGKTVKEVLPDTENIWIQRYGHVALTGESAHFEEYSAPLDKHFEVEAYSPSKGRFAVIFTDVTERNKAREMLIQSEKMLSLGGLAAGMAHEINNPLGGILQSAQNIARRLDPTFPANLTPARECDVDLSAMARYLDKRGIPRMLNGIADSGKRASKIVSSMLSFSRNEGTSRNFCQLSDIVGNAVTLAENDFGLFGKHDFRSIRIERNYDPTMPPVPCSRTQLEQVALNILRNAAQALSDTDPKPATPTIRISIFAEGDHAVLRIADNGPGLSGKDSHRIFDPFYTTKPPGKGTGLGLSVSYYIITQNHRGSFTLDSAPGQGAIFTIRLPLYGALPDTTEQDRP